MNFIFYFLEFGDIDCNNIQRLCTDYHSLKLKPLLANSDLHRVDVPIEICKRYGPRLSWPMYEIINKMEVEELFKV
jgi:hypothetical protein